MKSPTIQRNLSLKSMSPVVNVTGDATVSMLVAKSVGKLGEPKIKNWDDNLDDVR